MALFDPPKIAKIHPLCRPPRGALSVQRLDERGRWTDDNGEPARAFTGRVEYSPDENAPGIAWVAHCSCKIHAACPLAAALDDASERFSSAIVARRPVVYKPPEQGPQRRHKIAPLTKRQAQTLARAHETAKANPEDFRAALLVAIAIDTGLSIPGLALLTIQHAAGKRLGPRTTIMLKQWAAWIRPHGSFKAPCFPQIRFGRPTGKALDDSSLRKILRERGRQIGLPSLTPQQLRATYEARRAP